MGATPLKASCDTGTGRRGYPHGVTYPPNGDAPGEKIQMQGQDIGIHQLLPFLASLGLVSGEMDKQV